ncbi:disease resistance protein RGA2-like isoform X3 [Panicum virgatum]|uniref:disease resistance protein RGA2-like isoform X3 n=1 Tax=Panicum virgatum TaxID=38727 RepID=UPI0019D51AA9|nr:disease resistance protein RGA2-like isoform X3 [Panicum virgatum]
MASAVPELITGKFGELVWDEATLLWSFKDDVGDLKETMDLLQALMHDADKRQKNQYEGKTVQLWMKKFKSVAYDVEDLLDKLEAIQLIKQTQSKMKLFFSSYNPLLTQLTMAHKIKKLKKELAIIKEDGHHLHLVPNYNTPRLAEQSTNGDTVAWTNEDVDIEMIGRDTEKENIMKLLLRSEAEEHISIIPIVGLGGLGKTTLAQAVLSDKRAKIFDLRVWVFVSANFNLSRIGAIISHTCKSIGSLTSERYTENDDLQTIIEQLKTILPSKRYLIVLDDIWEEDEDNLEKLQQMLQYGGKGSKIILTTRIQRVVEKLDVSVLAKRRIICPVRKSDHVNLSFLSEDDCWNVMRQRALGHNDGISRLESIGREISRKCGGLPLLARSLGFLLSQNKSTEAWEDIRDREIILGMTEDHQTSKTLKSLMLSYYYMPFEVKLCFTYCAVFPKGFTIARDHLIQQWRALGYVQSIDGHHCISYLLGMSFLLISKSSQSKSGLKNHPEPSLQSQPKPEMLSDLQSETETDMQSEPESDLRSKPTRTRIRLAK